MPLCTKSLAISANCVVGAAYGLQFFLAPGFTIEQNFKVVPTNTTSLWVVSLVGL